MQAAQAVPASDGARRTSRVMTPFEMAKLLGYRIQQLNRGLPTVLGCAATGMSSRQIAERELACNLLPLIVRRRMPDGTHEDVHARSLRLPGDFRPEM